MISNTNYNSSPTDLASALDALLSCLEDVRAGRLNSVTVSSSGSVLGLAASFDGKLRLAISAPGCDAVRWVEAEDLLIGMDEGGCRFSIASRDYLTFELRNSITISTECVATLVIGE